MARKVVADLAARRSRDPTDCEAQIRYVMVSMVAGCATAVAAKTSARLRKTPAPQQNTKMVEEKGPGASEGTRGRGRRRKDGPSQLMELFFHLAEQLGITEDKDIADLADVSVENVSNWRSGAVQEFKPQKLRSIKTRLAALIGSLEEQAGVVPSDANANLSPLEVEAGSGPADLQRQFRDRVAYDYLGHRFLYYEPMGALAWENLIKRGYDQDRWLSGVHGCISSWMDRGRHADGSAKGPLADALGMTRRGTATGLDLVSLGPGEGDKEVHIVKQFLSAESEWDHRYPWLAYMPVDVSIPLLLVAARNARSAFRELAGKSRATTYQVRPFCADFEEGALDFTKRLPTSLHSEQAGLRLVLMLGNVFGNLRDEEVFCRERLSELMRPGDLLWLEVGLRLEPLDKDPLYRMTLPAHEESAAEANRRLLLEGPYRRWEAATGRSSSDLELRVWVREDDDTSRIPGSVNFCHDLVIKDERRVCTMLYSRRYELSALGSWLERQGFDVLRIQRVEDSRNQARVAHLLLRRHA